MNCLTTYSFTSKNSHLLACTLLDPRYKDLECVGRGKNTIYKSITEAINKSSVLDHIEVCDEEFDEDNDQNDRKKLVNKFLRLSETSHNNSQSKKFIDEIKEYVSIQFPWKENPIQEFYNLYEKQFNRLAKAASFFLSVPATSVPCERLFSQCEFQVISAKILIKT